MGRVFVTLKDSRQDQSDLLRYGTPVALSNRTVYPDEADERAPRIMADMLHLMSDFKPSEDYIALVGDPLLVAMAIAAVFRYPYREYARVLKWDSHERAYYAVILDPSSVLPIEEKAHGESQG